MRIEAVEKMGYYPTSPETEAILAQYIDAAPDTLVRLLDPCAGEGVVLTRLAAALQARGVRTVTFGVEAQEVRAEKAAAVLDHVVSADLFCTRISPHAFQCVLLNPPYDFSTTDVDSKNKSERHEYQFLQRITPMLAPEGVLIYIIPITSLTRDVAEYLCRHYYQVTAYKIVEAEYAQFRQVVILARRVKSESSDWEHAYDLYKSAQDTVWLDALGDDAEATQERAALLGKNRKAIPYLDSIHHSHLAAYLRIRTKGDPREKVVFRQDAIHAEQAIDLYRTSGVHTTFEWRDLVEPKKTYQITPPAPLKIGHIAGVMASGQIGVTQIGDDLVRGHTSRVTEWRNAQGEIVAETSEDAEIETERIIPAVITLNLKTGVTQIINDEKALAAYLADHATDLAGFVQTSCRPLYEGATWAEWEAINQYALAKKYPGHPGGLSHSQKHVALATARLLKTYGFAFLIGEQGTGKTVMSPSAVAYLQDIGQKALPAWVLCPAHLVEKWQREVEQVVPGAKALIAASITDLEAARDQYQPGQKLFVIVSKEMAKLGPGWAHALITRKGEQCCPRCYTPTEKKPGKNKLFCKKCGSPMFTFTGLHRWPLADYARHKMKGFFKTFIADECHHYNGKSSDQSRAYHHMVNATRYTLNLTGTMLGGKASDIFWILYRNSKKVRTDFGFHDEARWSAQFGRLERVYRASTTSSGKFSGRSQTPSYVRELPGTSPALYRYVLECCIFLRVQDLGLPMPTYQEELVVIPTPVAMAQQIESADTAMREVYGRRGPDTSQEERDDAARMLGVRTQIVLGRPNSAFRSETVHWTPVGCELPQPFFPKGSDKPYTMPALIRKETAELLPKESALCTQVATDLEAGRRSLIYIRQTGTRNIQPRIEMLLQERGIRAQILPETLEAKKREGWLRKNDATLDALIVNPRKVETGLDLVSFSSIYVYEPELSPYSLWQSLRRIWRPGQTKPARVKFMVYDGTMEHKAIRTLLRRMGSVLLVYGDEPGGALATLDEGNILMELTRTALMGDTGQLQDDSNLVTIQHTANTSQTSIWLSLSAPTDPSSSQVRSPKRNKHARILWETAMPEPRKKISTAQLSFLDIV